MFKIIAAAVLALASAAAFAATEVNKANQAELEAIKGIGPSMATRILDARKTGTFNNWADLQGRVKGVGDGNARKYSADGLTVNGQAYPVGGAAVVKAKGKHEKTPAKKVEAKAKS
ncbi:ComEA family DNA-binding protein [Piscinibacter sp.]|uniref:ComEA family DNA-binding protein n=1 Tax=Piscinibacter sp. TaxID=1903157 RepID=UPI0039E5AE51